MNFRVLTLKYMGWCPGVEAVAKFIPDRNIPPTRIALIILLVASISFSSFLVTQRTLTVVGFPSISFGRTGNESPKLVVVDDQIYIAVEVKTTGQSWADYHRTSIYIAKLSLDGKLEDETKVLDLGETLLNSMDLLVTKDSHWHLTYVYKKLFYHNSTEIPGDLYVISSDDGIQWDNPTVIAESRGRYTGPPMTEEARRKIRDFDNPSLTETMYGEVFLSFNINDDKLNYTIYDPKSGWNPPNEIPMLAKEQSSLIDREGCIAVVGVDINPSSPKVVIVEGLPFTTMRENGSWTEPGYLGLATAPLRGNYPKILYSSIRDGYFLLMEDPDPQEYGIHQISFTRDLEIWDRPMSFQNIREASLIELPDGTLVLVFNERGDLSISTSGDGFNWTPRREMDKIWDEEALVEVASRQRFVLSSLTSLATTTFAIIFMSKYSNLILGKLRTRTRLRYLPKPH